MEIIVFRSKDLELGLSFNDDELSFSNFERLKKTDRAKIKFYVEL